MIFQTTEYEPPAKIVTWGGGTDEEIAAMVAAHYKDKINLADYWSVGDERIVTLNGETQSLVLMHEGGKTLTTPINGHPECAFIVGLKNCMATKRAMNPSETNWNNCAMRTFCNGDFRNYFSATMRGIFKKSETLTAPNYVDNLLQTSNDYFALPAEKEVTGDIGGSNPAEDTLSQFTWYMTSSNRIKTINGQADVWYLRSLNAYGGSGYGFLGMSKRGMSQGAGYDNASGVSPYGCI